MCSLHECLVHAMVSCTTRMIESFVVVLVFIYFIWLYMNVHTPVIVKIVIMGQCHPRKYRLPSNCTNNIWVLNTFYTRLCSISTPEHYAWHTTRHLHNLHWKLNHFFSWTILSVECGDWEYCCSLLSGTPIVHNDCKSVTLESDLMGVADPFRCRDMCRDVHFTWCVNFPKSLNACHFVLLHATVVFGLYLSVTTDETFVFGSC